MHEAQLAGAGRSHFVLLSFEDDNLRALEAADPCRPRHSLWKRDLQLFMKRLRNRVGEGVKSFGSGEYGEDKLRPHYHVCLLHMEFPDLYPWKRTGSGNIVYRSPVLEQVWPYGFAHVGTLTQESAEYTARYALKKVSAELAAERYRRVDPDSGEVWRVQAEFALMSKGIGAGWLGEFAGDCASGFLISSSGHKVPVPRYYRERLSEVVQADLSRRGKAVARRHAADNTDSRLLVKHELRELKAARLVRELDA